MTISVVLISFDRSIVPISLYSPIIHRCFGLHNRALSYATFRGAEDADSSAMTKWHHKKDKEGGISFMLSGFFLCVCFYYTIALFLSLRTQMTRIHTFRPTPDRMIALAQLLTFGGEEHTARFSIHCPLLSLSAATRQSDGTASTSHEVASPSTPQTAAWPVFQLRVHFDLGPVVACAYPNQFYWLYLFFGQLSRIAQDYQSQCAVQSPTDDGHRGDRTQFAHPDDVANTSLGGQRGAFPVRGGCP